MSDIHLVAELCTDCDRTLFPAVEDSDGQRTTSGEYQSSDVKIMQTPGYLPTDIKSPRNPDLPQSTKSEAPEPNDEPVVANATLAAECTDHTDFSSAATEHDDTKINLSGGGYKIQEDDGEGGGGAKK